MRIHTFRRNNYMLDVTSPLEVNRLLLQNDIIHRAVSQLFPTQLNTNYVETVLDVACGPGGWAMDVAAQYPQMRVLGIDLEPTMIQAAREQVFLRQLPNAQFERMDLMQRLPFPSGSIDFVNARFLNHFLLRHEWTWAITELVRITRAGGSLRLIECDRWGRTTSIAYHQFEKLVMQGITHDIRGRYVDAIPFLGKMLHQAGLIGITEEVSALNFSHGSEMNRMQAKNLSLYMRLIQPFLISVEVSNLAQLQQLSHQVASSLLEEHFCSTQFLYTVWGRKRSC